MTKNVSLLALKTDTERSEFATGVLISRLHRQQNIHHNNFVFNRNTHSAYWSFLSAFFEMGSIRMLGMTGRSVESWLRCWMSFFLLKRKRKANKIRTKWAWKSDSFSVERLARSANHNSLATAARGHKTEAILGEKQKPLRVAWICIINESSAINIIIWFIIINWTIIFCTMRHFVT